MNYAILDAFQALVTTFAASLSPALPVAYPGIEFTPPATGEWLEIRAFPNETINRGLANDAPAELRGFFQVSACGRPGAGIMSLQSLADAVITGFSKGTTFGGARVERQPWVSSILTDDDRLIAPVTIPYRRIGGV